MRLWIRSQAQLEEDLLHVRLNRALGDEEAFGDSLVGEAFGDEAKDFSLAIGELGERILAPAPAEELGDDGRVDHGLALGDPAERIQEDHDVEDAVFEQVADSFGMLLEQPHRVVGLDILREKKHADVRMFRANFERWVKPNGSHARRSAV